MIISSIEYTWTSGLHNITGFMPVLQYNAMNLCVVLILFFFFVYKFLLLDYTIYTVYFSQFRNNTRGEQYNAIMLAVLTYELLRDNGSLSYCKTRRHSEKSGATTSALSSPRDPTKRRRRRMCTRGLSNGQHRFAVAVFFAYIITGFSFLRIESRSRLSVRGKISGDRERARARALFPSIVVPAECARTDGCCRRRKRKSAEKYNTYNDQRVESACGWIASVRGAKRRNKKLNKTAAGTGWRGLHWVVRRRRRRGGAAGRSPVRADAAVGGRRPGGAATAAANRHRLTVIVIGSATAAAPPPPPPTSGDCSASFRARSFFALGFWSREKS